MTHRLVVDCSYIMAGIFPDEKYQKASEIASFEIYVPAVFYLECGNVLSMALKKKRISEKEADEYLSILHRLPVILDNFSATSESIYTISKLAKKYDITTYDASYLELALRLDTKMASHDKILLSACKKNRIQLIH